MPALPAEPAAQQSRAAHPSTNRRYSLPPLLLAHPPNTRYSPPPPRLSAVAEFSVVRRISRPVNITIAHPSEAGVLTEIAFAAKRHWGYPEHWIAQWSSLLTVTPDFVATHSTYAARDDQRILGFSALAQSADILFLEHLWVLPPASARGVGRALFRRAQQRARDLGFASFEIESDPHAAGFYEHMGAERIGTNTTFLDGKPRELPIFRCRTSHESDRIA